MTASRWFDRWQWTDPETRCHCGHLLRDHPAARFRSCSACVWCDDFREPPGRRVTMTVDTFIHLLNEEPAP